LGATLTAYGAKFSVFAKRNTTVQLLFFDRTDEALPSRIVDLDPHVNRTYQYWHCFVPAVMAGQLYAYRLAGPFDPQRGLRFDANKVLLDPYGSELPVRLAEAGRQRGTRRQRRDRAEERGRRSGRLRLGG
jgi:isoamylase